MPEYEIIKNTLNKAKHRINSGGYLTTLHLLLTLFEENDPNVSQPLSDMGVSLSALQKAAKETLQNGAYESPSEEDSSISGLVQKALKVTYLENKILHKAEIDTTHLIMAMLRDEDTLAAGVLARFGVEYEGFLKKMKESNFAL